MKNKKGFTLIELLAVIVIMAILALIAIPIVINIISDSRENANKQSIINYARAVEKDVVTWKGEDTKRQFTDYELAYKERDIKVTGNKVKCDKAIVDKEGELTLKKCYLVKYENDENKKLYDYINGQVYESESDETLVSEYASLLEENYKLCKQNSETTDYLQCALNKMNESEIECEEKTIDSEEKAVLKSCYRKGTEESKRKYYNYESGKSSKTEGSGNSTNGTSETNGNSTSGASYNSYSVGDTFSIHGDSYHVIADSPKTQNYVVALKDKPLTYEEMIENHYGQGYINKYTYDYVGQVYNYNGYGGMVYYSSPTCGRATSGGSYSTSGCASENATNYDSSDIKHVVDDWAADKFSSNELKEVTVVGYGNYKVRLATKEELQPIGWPSCTESQMSNNGYCPKESTTSSWLWNSNYWYWTMTPYNSSSIVWFIYYDGLLDGHFVFDGVGGAVRPVINVYKSSI